MIWVARIATAMLFAIIPALVASNRGRSGALWWAYGLLFWPVALVHALLLQPNDRAWSRRGYTRCTRCSEFIRQEALVCRFCGAPSQQSTTEPIVPTSEPIVPTSSTEQTAQPERPLDSPDEPVGAAITVTMVLVFLLAIVAAVLALKR